MSVEQLVEWELAGENEVLEKTCPGATLSATNPTWIDLGPNRGHCGGKPATNRLSYGTALMENLVFVSIDLDRAPLNQQNGVITP
jgi:hypothetical protein